MIKLECTIEKLAIIFLLVLLSTQFLIPMMVITEGGSAEIAYDSSRSTTRYYLREAVITPPYRELNLTAGDAGTAGNWTVDGPGIYTFTHVWATEPMSQDILVHGRWNYSIYVEKPMNTSFDPTLRGDIYIYDGVEENLLHQGITNVSIDQTGVVEYRWYEEVPEPAAVQEDSMVVVKFVLDASGAPELEYMDQPEELTMLRGTVTGYLENATEGDVFTLTEESGEVINETRYFRGIPDEVVVNNMTAYSLGIERSDNMQQSESMETGGDFHCWGIRAWIRNENGIETEITPGHAVAVVFRSENEEGYQNNTWDPPESSLSPTDSIVIRLYQERANDPPTNLVANFTTEQLGASQLDAATWTIHYYTYRGGAGFNGIYWGDPDHDTRIEGFRWRTTEGYVLDARMEIREIPSAQYATLEYKIDTDQPEFQLRISRDEGTTYDTIIQEELSAGTFSRPLQQDEISGGTVYLQMLDRGTDDAVQYSVDMDYVRVSTTDNITLHWNYPVDEYASYLEFPVISAEPAVDYISIVDSPNTGFDNITDQSVNAWFDITGYAASFNFTYDYIGDVDVNWSVENFNGANAYTDPLEGNNSTFYADGFGGTAYWNASYYYDGVWYNDSVLFTIYPPGGPEINNVTAAPDPQIAGGYVNISCDVTSADGVDGVWANITYPDNSYANNSMILGSGDHWYLNDTYYISGVYDFTILARDDLDQWNISTGHSFTIEPEAADLFIFDTIMSPQVAGQAFTITITAYDTYGNVATDYTGTATLSDTTGTINPAVTGTFIDGAWTGDVTINTAMDGVNITAVDTVDLGISGVSNDFDVVVAPADHFIFDTIESPQVAEQAFTITITAFDEYENVAADYTGTATLSDTTGTINPTTTAAFIDGAWTGDVTIYDAMDGVNITAVGTVDPDISGVSNDFDVITMGELNHFEFDIIDSPQVAGQPFTITITAYDEYENVDTNYTGTATLNDTTGSIEPTSTTAFTAGVWTGDVTITTAHEDITITAQDGDIVGTSNVFDVEPGPIYTVNIYPEEDQTVSAGEDLQFSAEARDEHHNLITDDVTDFDWSGADANGVFNRETVGEYDVTASYGDVTSDPTTVTVEPAEAENLDISPDGVTLQAGHVQEYTAEASDAYGNEFNVTEDTVFSIDEEAGGVWFDNAYSSEIAGTWNVTGMYGDLEGTATLTVQPPSVDYIIVTPEHSTITAGETETYTADAYDEYGNFVADVTMYMDWEIDTDAGGSWDDNVYTSEFAGTWTITGTYGKSRYNVSLTVEPTDIDHIVISPETSTIAAGASQEYTATTRDHFGNLIDDVTPYVVWSIEEEAGGRWDLNIYTSWSTGTWTVTGTYGPFEDTAVLTVEATDLDPALFEIFIVSGNEQVKTAGTRSDEPLVVEVRDQFGAPVGRGWKVWFNITTEGLNGDGELSRASPALTDDNGTASIWLTLDSARGENNITAEVTGDDEFKQVIFSVTGTLPEFDIELSLNARRVTSGDVVVYKISYENTGTEAAANVWITLEIDNKLIYVSDTSDMTHTVIEGTYTWHFTDVEVGIHRFDVVCRVIDDIHRKHIVRNYAELEYTDAQGEYMPSVMSNEETLEIDITIWDKLFWPWPLIPIILILLIIFWYLYKKIEIEDVFLIYGSGLLIAHKSAGSTDERPRMDMDIFSGMLSVIQDFVKDSFQEEENYGIKRLEFGDKRILVEKGKYTFMAVVFNGRVVGPIEKKMESVLKEIETEYDEILDGWDGSIDDMEGVEYYIEELF